jgi:hypothetical protein
MTPTLLSPPKPLTAAASAHPVIDSPLRIRLSPTLDRRAVVDGAWWPYSRDAAAELPALIAAVDQRLDRITVGIGVHRDAWDHIPRGIPARGRQVRVGRLHHIDPRVITLIFAVGEPVVLLVIPPGAARGSAGAAFRPFVQDTTGGSDGAAHWMRLDDPDTVSAHLPRVSAPAGPGLVGRFV